MANDVCGFSCAKLDSILDFYRDGNTVDKADQYIVTKRGQRKLRQTTAGWHFLIQLSDRSQLWKPLRDLKAEHPIEVAEFAVANRIDDEPAFKWWVRYTLQKRDRIIASVRSRVLKRTHKYGIEIPTSGELNPQSKVVHAEAIVDPSVLEVCDAKDVDKWKSNAALQFERMVSNSFNYPCLQLS